MAELTFRDFAGAVMKGDTAAAGKVLEELLGLAPAAAAAAADHFATQMKSGGPAFMGKSMGLRAAVTTGTDEEIRSLLADCFDLRGDAAEPALATLRSRYRAQS